MVLFASPVTCRDVVVNAESSRKRVAKVELVDTCTRYVVAPLAAFHDRLTVVGWPVAPFAGKSSVGVGGGGNGFDGVEKLRIPSFCVPAEF